MDATCDQPPGVEPRSKKAYVYENAGGSSTLSETEEFIQNEIDIFDEDGYSAWDD